jgi:hypothetical protein
MIRANNKLKARFGPETRFVVHPVPPAPFRATQESDFERLKNRLLTETLLAIAQPDLNVSIRRAANEAAALAWITFYPLLVFPGLFEEKLHHALRRDEHQARVYAQSRELAAVQ